MNLEQQLTALHQLTNEPVELTLDGMSRSEAKLLCSGANKDLDRSNQDVYMTWLAFTTFHKDKSTGRWALARAQPEQRLEALLRTFDVYH